MPTMKRLPDSPLTRRSFLGGSARLALLGALLPAHRLALASLPPTRSLALEHLHTGERLTLDYAIGDRYLPDALQALNRLLRDHYSGEMCQIAPGLFDQLHRLQALLGPDRALLVISGYRCPETNEMLRQRGGGGVARQSLHTQGRAVDIRMAGVALSELREAALAMNAGGVGFYPAQQFVHIDTGRVRSW